MLTHPSGSTAKFLFLRPRASSESPIWRLAIARSRVWAGPTIVLESPQAQALALDCQIEGLQFAKLDQKLKETILAKGIEQRLCAILWIS